MDDRDLEIPEERFAKKTRRNSLLISVLFHVGVLTLFAFWTCAAPTEPEEELTEITWGGGAGGAPDVVGPEGPSQRGNPDVTEPAVPRQPRTTPDRIETPTTRTPSDEKIPTTKPREKPTEEPRPVETPEPTREPAQPSQQPGQDPQGTGSTPSRGTGGEGSGEGSPRGGGSGYSVSGLGNRGWSVRPTAKYPDGSNATGTVVLRFTVQPDGSITGIAPIKRASEALVSAAMAGLRRARMRPLPSEAPQSPQQGTITYTFRLND